MMIKIIVAWFYQIRNTKYELFSAMVMTCKTTSERVMLKNISWPTYVAMLAEMGNDLVTRVAYDRGMLEIMSPSLRHENWKRLI